MTGVPCVLENKLKDSISTAKVLVVGAGGIGCEILKNLALSGFNDIEVIDLDTIDVSNLNRQFLFRKEHVGKSKALVAKESVLNFNPDIKIKAYHDSITSNEYGVNFFKRFKVVLNALDNRAARNHVNRMCLAADVPLIESGTAGYSGQVEFIKKGLTQCYECQPKAPQKTFPGCTIRNTPSEPVHCIVWAKHLYNQLFGEEDPDQDVSPDTADPEATGGAGEGALAAEAAADGNVKRTSTRQWAQEIKYDPQKLFTKFFEDDIKYLLSMENLWKNRVPPVPLAWKDIPGTEPSSSTTQNNTGLRDMQVWDLSKCAFVFSDSIGILKTELAKKGAGDYLIWDKDDKPAMDFVTACANIRSHIFGIQKKSLFDAKSIAGNIIPAIATTNAMIAGLVVLHAFRVLADEYKKCLSIYLRQHPNHRNMILVPDRSLTSANPKCYVCSPQPEIGVCVDVNNMTVKEFESEILKKSLNMVAPDAMLQGQGLVVISSEEGETEQNNNKKLKELGIVDGSILKADDFLQNYELSITINHYEPKDKEDPPYKIIADPSQLKAKEDDVKMNGNNGAGDGKEAEEESDDDDLCVVEYGAEEGASASKKRRLDTDDDDDLIMLDEPLSDS